MKELSYINFIVAILFAVCYSYHAIYTVVALIKKQKKFVAKKQHKYAVLIAARNEEAVISQLVESIRWQKYPRELLDIFVIADNCTDKTAEVARGLGCTVYERQNKVQVGKGYALDFLFSQIYKNHAQAGYEGYIVFDADNIADENFVAEMNKVFDNGYNVVTSYRNSKNFDDNWISAGYSLWFLRESKFMNNPRMTLGASASITGTGFLMSAKIIEENKGWKYFTLTEDIEFTFERITRDDMIGYAEDAIVYDEQPTQLGQSINQRSRWIKGYMQVFKNYKSKMAKKIFLDGSFSSYDVVMNGVPSYFLTLFSLAFNVLMFLYGILTGQDMNIFIYSCVTTIANAYLVLLFVAGLTAITERKRIIADQKRLVLFVFLFPFYVATFMPGLMLAVFTNVTWKPMKHKAAYTVKAMKKSDEK